MRRFTASSVLALALCGAAFAQPDASQPLPTAQQMLAHRLEQIARSLLQTNDQVQPFQTTQALVLLDYATQFDPDDAERWRLKAEALELAGRHDELVDAVQGYLRLRPDDDAAQLQLIRLLADRQQTADLRLAYFNRIVEGEHSRRFSKPLRSRVAYAAAMLQLEQGRMDEYARLLSLALSLDQTNKRAAAESFQALLQDRESGRREQAAALFTLFNADPIDPATHAAVADMLFSLGRFDEAGSWYRAAIELESLRGRSPGVGLVHSLAMTMWGAGDTGAALQLLGWLEPPPHPPAEPAPDAAGAAPPSQPSTQQAPPAEAPTQGPPTETLMLRSVILSAGGDIGAPVLEESFNRLLRRYADMRAQSPRDPDLLTSLIWAHLLTGRQAEAVGPLIDELARLGAEQSLLTLLRGWLAVHTNLPDQAQTLLTPLSADDSRAKLGLAYALQQLGDQEQATRLFQQLAQSTPHDIFGLLAVSRLRRMSLMPPQPPQAQEVADLFNSIPPALRDMSRRPLQYVQLDVKPVNLRHNVGEPIQLAIQLRNVGEFPLGLGPAATLAPRVFLLPTVSADGQTLPPLPPLVVDMRRRLRIDPQQSLSVTVRLDSGWVSQMLDAHPASFVQIDVTAMLNPRLTPGGSFTPGLLGSQVHVRNIVRRSPPLSPEFVEAKLAEFLSPDPAVAMAAMKALLRIAPMMPEQLSDLRQRIAATAADAFTRMPEMVQAWAVTYAIDDRPDVTEHLYQGLLDQAAASPSSLVRIVLLASRVDTPDSPFLIRAIEQDTDEQVRQFALAVRERLLWVQKLQAEQEAAASHAAPASASPAPAP